MLNRIVVTALVSVAALATAGVAAADEQPFADEIHVFQVEDEVAPANKCATLFVGSSSFRFWFRMREDFPGRDIVKRGFGGSRIADINRYFDTVVGQYRPRQIVFYAGENDLAEGKTVDAVAADFEAFMKRKTEVLGTTPVYYVSAKPSLARAGEFTRQSELNGRIRDMAGKESDLVFVDIVPAMLRDGKPRAELFISDGLHMKEQGYVLWRGIIEKALREAKASKAPDCP